MFENFDCQKDVAKILPSLRLQKEKSRRKTEATLIDRMVATANMTENPVLVLIEDQEIAKGYVAFFQLFWKLAKK